MNSNRRYTGNPNQTPVKLRTNAPKATTESEMPDDLDDESYYLTKSPTSAVRWRDRQGNQVIQRGNKRIVVHDKPARPHWLVISGLSMIALLMLWWLLSWLTSWVANNQINATYEYPRVSQADAVVYPGDSPDHPSHYLFLNLNGQVLIVELPHGDSAKSRIYKGPTLFGDGQDQIPITGEFRVVNGKIEMLVHIQDKVILYINDGTQFIPQ